MNCLSILGSLLTVFGQATFTSARSVEVEVIVECECFRRGNPMDTFRERAADAFFTYVCMGKDGKTQPVPPLKVHFMDLFYLPAVVTSDHNASWISFCSIMMRLVSALSVPLLE